MVGLNWDISCCYFSMSYGLRQCSNGYQWLMALFCEWQCEGERLRFWLSPAEWPSNAPSSSIYYKCTPDYVCLSRSVSQIRAFGWALVDVCSSPLKREGDLHSALSGRTITAHLIPNWSWREDIRNGECSWTLTAPTAVDVSISALYLICMWGW